MYGGCSLTKKMTPILFTKFLAGFTPTDLHKCVFKEARSVTRSSFEQSFKKWLTDILVQNKLYSFYSNKKNQNNNRYVTTHIKNDVPIRRYRETKSCTDTQKVIPKLTKIVDMYIRFGLS